MSVGKIIAGLVAAFFAVASLAALIWGIAVWLSTWLEPIAVPFVLTGILAFAALVAVLVMKSIQPGPAGTMLNAAIPAASSTGGPSPEDLELLSRLCTQKPIMGLAASFALGIVQGWSNPERKR
jgi:hypothetical protein